MPLKVTRTRDGHPSHDAEFADLKLRDAEQNWRVPEVHVICEDIGEHEAELLQAHRQGLTDLIDYEGVDITVLVLGRPHGQNKLGLTLSPNYRVELGLYDPLSVEAEGNLILAGLWAKLEAMGLPNQQTA